MNISRVSLVACLGLLFGASTCFAQMYTVTNLGTRQGGNSSSASAINSLGQVVGGSYLLTAGTNAPHAFLWNGSYQDIGTLGGVAGSASGINDSGVIVGTSYLLGDYPWHAFVYDGTLHDLGNTLGGEQSNAQDINNAGTVVGCATVAGPASCHAYMYDGQMHDLGVLDGYDYQSQANAINESGLIVGTSVKALYPYPGQMLIYFHAFLYNGALHDLGTLGGSESEATDINDWGQIVGSSNRMLKNSVVSTG